MTCLPAFGVRATTIGHEIFLRLSTSCRHGADFSVGPTAANVVRVAHAGDGHTAAVVLDPLQNRFQIVVSPPPGPRYLVAVRLT